MNSRDDSTGHDFFPGPAGRSQLFGKGRESRLVVMVDFRSNVFKYSVIVHLAGSKGLLDYQAIDIWCETINMGPKILSMP